MNIFLWKIGLFVEEVKNKINVKKYFLHYFNLIIKVPVSNGLEQDISGLLVFALKFLKNIFCTFFKILFINKNGFF